MSGLRRIDIPRLDGGLNLREAEMNLKDNESPELINVWWENGVLHSRPGQEWASASVPEDEESGENPVTYAVTSEPFRDHICFHAGDQLFELRPGDDTLTDSDKLPIPHILCSGVPRAPGTFFRFADCLYYKNPGGFYQLSPDGTVSSMDEHNAYIPTTWTDVSPFTGQGVEYEPRNRLGIQQRVCYTPVPDAQTTAVTGDGLKRAFALDISDAQNIRNVYFDHNKMPKALYQFDPASGVVIFLTAPADGVSVTLELDIGNRVYHLPESGVDSVDEVRVDGLLMNPDRDYTVDLESGLVTFRESPPVHDPAEQNTVEIVYSRAGNHTAERQALLDCPHAAVFTGGSGSAQTTCIVFGGGVNAPDTFFWTDRPDYWPVPHSHSISDAANAITAFSRFANHLIIFRTAGIDKASVTMEHVNGWNHPVISRGTVHETVGALPGSVRTAGNHLIFCAPDGVYLLRSVSSAYENSVVRVSEKISGSLEHPGLLHDLSVSHAVSAHDDGQHYFLSVNDHIWVWDHGFSTLNDPVWFFFTDVHPAAWFLYSGTTYHLNAAGRVTRLGHTLSDYGEPIRKVYQFPVRSFGGYDRLKDVLTVILSVPADTPSDTVLTYETDYETRADRVKLQTSGYNRLGERDLSVRDLSVPRHAAVFRRRPVCRHVRHFSMRLENRTVDCDMGILSAEIQYRFLGRDR